MAKTTYRVRVADITRYDDAGEPVRRVTLPAAVLTASEIRVAIARGASVVCIQCGEPWDWCSYLVQAVEPGLGAVRDRLVAAYMAEGVPVPPICRSREAAEVA